MWVQETFGLSDTRQKTERQETMIKKPWSRNEALLMGSSGGRGDSPIVPVLDGGTHRSVSLKGKVIICGLDSRVLVCLRLMAGRSARRACQGQGINVIILKMAHICVGVNVCGREGGRQAI